ncbi:MAG: hypothetical protein GXZ09_01160 [Syntrophomonadaceae bacterium]|jgi:hypothetical protein|nr:hypothetical protein [Syntrophomonadaceae bacterium]
MAIRRHVYPGGNTRFGFFSFYDQVVGPDVTQKIILKGGPGVGKSSFMQKIADHFSGLGVDIEEHGCSSDPASLDAVVIGKQQFCLLDGTSPHVVDPVYPGAVDEILNLGDYWDQAMLKAHRKEIMHLTQEIAKCFLRAYGRLRECCMAYDELKHYYAENRISRSLKRNLQALTADFLAGSVSDYRALRHLFAGALTPGGLITRLETLIDQETAIFAVKGSPGSGVQDLFSHTKNLMEQGGIYGEIFHNPVDPDDIDYILVPSSNSLLIHIEPALLPYREIIKGRKLKRQLDFDQLLDHEGVANRSKLVFAATHRYHQGISEAVQILQTAKKWHDELEAYYVPAMDFAAVDTRRQQIVAAWQEQLGL